MKRCPSCGEDKPLDQFGRNKARYDGLQSYCRACKTAKRKAQGPELLRREAEAKRARRAPHRKYPPVAMDEKTAALVAQGKRKVCCHCRTVKVVGRFGADASMPDGKKPYCKLCKVDYGRCREVRKLAGHLLTWQIAERLGVTETELQQLASKYGISLAYLHLPWTLEQDEELLRLRRQGMTRQQIATQLGRTLKAVSWEIHKLRKQGKIP